MKIRVSEASGNQLDWLVAICEGYQATIKPTEIVYVRPDGTWHHNGNWCPTSNPAQGQPILEREKLMLWFEEECPWYSVPAGPAWGAGREGIYRYGGPTMLIAGLRAFVASKLGDEVEIPEELA